MEIPVGSVGANLARAGGICRILGWKQREVKNVSGEVQKDVHHQAHEGPRRKPLPQHFVILRVLRGFLAFWLAQGMRSRVGLWKFFVFGERFSIMKGFYYVHEVSNGGLLQWRGCSGEWPANFLQR